MHLTCTQCQQTLPSEDATATHCRFCRAPLPHGEAAARHQEMMRNFMANPGGHAAPPVYGAPVAYAQGPVVFGAIGHASQISAMVTRSVDRSMKTGLWITIATLVGTFLVTGVLMLSAFLR